MIVVVSTFVVANEMSEEVEAAFAARPHDVDQAPGFLSLRVLRPNDDAREFWLVTNWEDEASYQTWFRGHGYQDAHKGMPKGLKLVPGTTQIRVMREVAR